jgi:16S rRNA C967 or C1407 C5-methylase (RsmB/RsmF family)/NOL1/NOP2/fmu family ribosome biogenesis protein
MIPAFDLSFLPGAFISRMENQLGKESADFFNSLGGDPSLSIRLNPSKPLSLPEMEPVPWCSTGYFLNKRPSFTADPLFHAGTYYVQEPGSMLLEKAFQMIPRSGPRLILDLCGAPGGKSTHLLALMHDNDLLVANEVIRSRAVILQENIRKWGYPNVIVSGNDPRDFSGFTGLFDIIVADVPCSGEGLFRKDPASAGEWSVNNTQLCASRQRRIIADVWSALRPGGYLIYSTCTYNPAENEENLRWISEQYDAESVEIIIKPEWNLKKVNFGNITGIQTMPHLTKAEGYFTGIIRKKESHSSGFKIRKQERNDWVTMSPAAASGFRDMVSGADKEDFLLKDNTVYYLKNQWHPLIRNLNKPLYLFQAGIPVAQMKGHESIPHHALALSSLVNPGYFREEALSLNEAILFLRKENLTRPLEGKGWIMPSYRGFPLGWLKNLGTRSNNYYPKEWRIRMDLPEIPVPWHEV